MKTIRMSNKYYANYNLQSILYKMDSQKQKESFVMIPLYQWRMLIKALVIMNREVTDLKSFLKIKTLPMRKYQKLIKLIRKCER